MTTLNLRLPDSLHQKIRELADRDNISINQFIATAVAEKAAALLTIDYLEARGRRADVRLFESVLARVPDAPPIPGDEMPWLGKRPKSTSSGRRKARTRNR